MIDLVSAVAERLQDELGGELRTIGSTTDLAAGLEELLKQRHALPAAYAHPIADAADRNRYAAGAVSQQVVQRIGVLLVIAAQGQRRTGPIADALALPRELLRHVLVGWAPDAEYAPVELAGGEIVHVGGGVAVWLERYRSDVELRRIGTQELALLEPPGQEVELLEDGDIMVLEG